MSVQVAKCQDWEGNAARAVSIAPEMASLSSTVARWRRLELRAWSGLLEAREGVYRRTARAWWLKLYDTLVCGDFYKTPVVVPAPIDGDGASVLMPFFLIHRSHSIKFTRAQGIPKYNIGFGRGKDGRVGERLVDGGGGTFLM